MDNYKLGLIGPMKHESAREAFEVTKKLFEKIGFEVYSPIHDRQEIIINNLLRCNGVFVANDSIYNKECQEQLLRVWSEKNIECFTEERELFYMQKYAIRLGIHPNPNRPIDETEFVKQQFQVSSLIKQSI